MEKIEVIRIVSEEEGIELDKNKLNRLLIGTYILAQRYFILEKLADKISCISNFITRISKRKIYRNF